MNFKRILSFGLIGAFFVVGFMLIEGSIFQSTNNFSIKRIIYIIGTLVTIGIICGMYWYFYYFKD